jgi:hypothetical protein
MKKWHMEGIVRPGAAYGQRLVIPAEDQMYGRIRGYKSAQPKECVLVELLRKAIGWFLRMI